MVQSALHGLERCGQIEDLGAVLNGDHAARGEMVAVARTIDFVDDGRIEVAAAQEIGVQGVRVASLDGGRRRHQRLPQHLAAENLGTPDVAALSAEKIILEPLERHDFDQILEQPVHGRLNAHRPRLNPRRLPVAFA